jgi:hypothetical protein
MDLHLNTLYNPNSWGHLSTDHVSTSVKWLAEGSLNNGFHWHWPSTFGYPWNALQTVSLFNFVLLLQYLMCLSVDQINVKSESGFLGIKQFRILQLLISVGVILSIVGGTSVSANENGTITIPTTVKAGIILFLVVFAAMVLIFVFSITKLGLLHSRERLVALAIATAAPFIFVRLLYSVLSDFLHSHEFNIVDGSVAIHVAMSVIEEFIVVLIYLILGFIIDKLENDKRGPIASRPWKVSRQRGNTGDDNRLHTGRYPTSSANRDAEQDTTEHLHHGIKQAHVASNPSGPNTASYQV